MRQNALLEKLVADQLRTDIPSSVPRFSSCSRTYRRGSRERIQIFEGVVIKLRVLVSSYLHCS